ncbi:MAG: hypothetical protein HYY46_09285 [Deltaproteobacteria bacterium]|nr:hypothetical protein [Deltaproteobacteria bacterium]
MEKKLSQDSIGRIDEAIQRFVAAWNDLKRIWANVDMPPALDKAFYDFVEVWLATDRAVDRETHAHSLEYWDDPDLEKVRQAIMPLQVRLSKIDDPRRKQQGIEKLLQHLQAIEF